MSTGAIVLPGIVVDQDASILSDPLSFVVGFPSLPPMRIVSALSSNGNGDGPLEVFSAQLVCDSLIGFLGGPDGSVVGFPPVWINRMVYCSRGGDVVL